MDEIDNSADTADTTPDVVVSVQRFDAVVFDLDGVITDTARTHRAAWKEVFDEFLRRRVGPEFRQFSDDDYRRYVDGKPRFDGVRSFLASRDIELPEGDEEDGPGFDTVCGLGMEKNRLYGERIAAGQLEVFDDALKLLEESKRRGLSIGLVSSSRNAQKVLQVLEIEDQFDSRVDGNTLIDEGLAGKPAPDMFVEVLRRLDVEASRAVVVEDAESGVEAGRRAGYGLVVGLARGGGDARRELENRGAHVVVETLWDLRIVAR